MKIDLNCFLCDLDISKVARRSYTLLRANYGLRCYALQTERETERDKERQREKDRQRVRALGVV